MRIRDAVFRAVGPGPFSGVTLGRWAEILRDNRFSVDWPYWPRAAVITLNALPNTLISWCETIVYHRKIKAAEVHPPVFILGSWRSGTTHLHNLLTVDDRFGFANFFQVSFPNTFLLTERTGAWLMDLCVPRTRPQDDVKFGAAEPQEEEFAFSSLTGHSILLSLAFPRNARFYDRLLTLRDLSEDELQRWKTGFVWFLKKLSFKHGRSLILKSPGHTCRIKILLELFPDARFVHIRRHPYHVHQSAQHTVLKAQPWWRLQTAELENGDDRLIKLYKETYDTFFTDKLLIPPERFHEMAFEDLETDPVGQIKKTYESLALPDFTHVEERLQTYVHSLSEYRKNVFPPLSPVLQQQISTECRMCFEAWGYSQ